MKLWHWLSPAALLGCLALAVGLNGCSPTVTRGPANPTERGKEQTEEQLCKQLAVTGDALSIREVLHQLAPLTARAEVTEEITQISGQQRELLQKDFQLNAEELAEVESVIFRPMDAHYMESCMLLRDVARQLDQATRDADGNPLAPLELIRFAFGWVNRRILPGITQTEVWIGPTESVVPPAYVLRRGFGGPRDRALLFLDLLQQLQMEGCILDGPHPLVGVILQDNLYLFDPALGTPVPADSSGKGVATFAMVVQKPELLEPLGISAKDAKEFARSEIVLNCPLSGLAPRLKVLDRFQMSNLSDSERTALFVDAARLRQNVAALTKKPLMEVGIGQRPSPTVSLFSFLPPEEGGRKALGQDVKAQQKESAGRLRRLRDLQYPFGIEQMKVNFARLRLNDPNVLNHETREFLSSKSLEILRLYCVEPHDMLIRGQYLPMAKRLKRISDILEDAPSLFDIEFQKDLALWCDMAQRAKLKNALSSFWKQDLLFFGILDVNSDLDPKMFGKNHDLGMSPKPEEEKDDKKAQRKMRSNMLSHVVLTGCCRGLVDRQFRYLLAEDVLEKAEALEARLESLRARAEKLRAGKADAQRVREADTRIALTAGETRYAWDNVRRQMGSYLQKFKVRSTMVDKFFQDFAAFRRVQEDFASLETLQRAWAMSCFARLNMAKALAHFDMAKAAMSELNSLESDLDALARSEDFQSKMAGFLPDTNIPKSPLLDEFRGPALQNLQRSIALSKRPN